MVNAVGLHCRFDSRFQQIYLGHHSVVMLLDSLMRFALRLMVFGLFQVLDGQYLFMAFVIFSCSKIGHRLIVFSLALLMLLNRFGMRIQGLVMLLQYLLQLPQLRKRLLMFFLPLVDVRLPMRRILSPMPMVGPHASESDRFCLQSSSPFSQNEVLVLTRKATANHVPPMHQWFPFVLPAATISPN